MAAYVLSAPQNYGYVVFTALGLIPTLAFLQGLVVGLHRKPAKLPYPNAYATPQQCKESREAYQFNCAQRAHHQLLENMPQVMITMLFAGLKYPVWTAAMGAVWVVCRGLYAYGYITSQKPNGGGRYLGAAYYLPQVGIWGLAMEMGFRMIG